MPFYYDINAPITTNVSGGSESTHLWGKTVASQQTLSICGIFCASRFATAGGGVLRAKTNTGVVASGGNGVTPAPRNQRNPAAQSVWANDGSAITPGTTLTTRMSVGFAQSGGMGGWVAMEPEAAIALMPGGANPLDAEFVSIANAASVTADLTVEMFEGV